MHITKPNPTKQTYAEFQRAFDHFNAGLFAGTLPPCLITLQRHARMYGYFSGDRFGSAKDATADEIAMNPQHFAGRSARDVFSTLAHEMAHLWQHHMGAPSRGCYHNREWAAKMKAIGLHPSATAEPGGKETGQSVSHYIIKGGPFDKVCAALLKDGVTVTWHDRASGDASDKAKKTGKRAKYTCPGCDANVWGKEGLNIICDDCGDVHFVCEATE